MKNFFKKNRKTLFYIFVGFLILIMMHNFLKGCRSRTYHDVMEDDRAMDEGVKKLDEREETLREKIFGHRSNIRSIIFRLRTQRRKYNIINELRDRFFRYSGKRTKKNR